MQKEPLKIAFDLEGNQMCTYYHTGGRRYIKGSPKFSWTDDCTVVDNYTFEDTLILSNINKNHIIFIRKSTNTTVIMFQSHFQKIAHLLKNGKIKGVFTFYKSGGPYSTYGCKSLGTNSDFYQKN